MTLNTMVNRSQYVLDIAHHDRGRELAPSGTTVVNRYKVMASLGESPRSLHAHIRCLARRWLLYLTTLGSPTSKTPARATKYYRLAAWRRCGCCCCVVAAMDSCSRSSRRRSRPPLDGPSEVTCPDVRQARRRRRRCTPSCRSHGICVWRQQTVDAQVSMLGGHAHAREGLGGRAGRVRTRL